MQNFAAKGFALKKCAFRYPSAEPSGRGGVIELSVSVGRLPPYPPNSRLAKGPERKFGAFFL